MIRACLAIAVFAAILIVFGIPLFILGLIHPSLRIFAFAAVVWARLMLWICGARLTIVGREHIAHSPRFFVGNHQSALDIPILIVALAGRVRFMAKHTLFRVPIFGWILYSYGFVPVHRDRARVSLKSAERMLNDLRVTPISLVVFPEGTRSRDGRLLPFRKGTMKICKRAGIPVVPFAIDGSIRVNHRDEFRAQPGSIRLVFTRPIEAEEIAAMTAAELNDSVLSAVVGALERPTNAPMLNEQAVPSPWGA